MTPPPSDNIEFYESTFFKKVTVPLPQLRQQVLEYLRSWPTAGSEFARGVREVTEDFSGKKYSIIYKRVGNHIGVMHLYESPAQDALLEKTKSDIVDLHGQKK
jgi:hypothetical protein